MVEAAYHTRLVYFTSGYMLLSGIMHSGSRNAYWYVTSLLDKGLNAQSFSNRLPKCGETIHGTSFQRDFGGKGANQCIAATRLGAKTALVACLGDDMFGKEYLTHLQNEGVDTSHVSLIKGQSCGIAQISVADNGDNHITIVAGANNSLSEDAVLKSSELLNQAEVVVFQFETPIKTTIQTLKYCKDHNPKAITIVNAAPACTTLDSEIYKYTDILCVNESEAQVMTGLATSSVAECEVAIRSLLSRGCKTIVLTRGRDGAMFASKQDDIVRLEKGSPVTNPVDTVGAGDVFLGALAYCLAYRAAWPMERQVRVACAVAAVSITRRGTQASFPRAAELTPILLAG